MKEKIILIICGILLSGLFLVLKAPFIAGFFLLAELIIFITAYRIPEKPILNKIIFAFPKIILALTFLGGLGYMLFLYLQSIKCLNCLQSIRTSAALSPIPISETPLEAFWYVITHSYPRVTFFFTALFMVAAIGMIWSFFHRKKHKKGGKKHA